jgi:multiple sugar transport system permease protein
MSSTGTLGRQGRRVNPTTLRHLRNGLLFASPWLLGFLMFVLYPIIASFYYSFTSYPIGRAPSWIGVGNYSNLFQDELFWKSLYNSAYYVVFFMPLGTLWALAAAFLLNVKVRGILGFRTLFFMPTIVPLVAASVVWTWVFNPQYGLLNGFLSLFGIKGGSWLNSPELSKAALIMMSVWGVGNAIVIYLAALQDVPVELYEAAEIDGASSWRKIVNIALPIISPAILFNVIIGLIGAFQYFTQAYVMTQGGPMYSTLFYSLYLYYNAFQYFKMGYASAMAWILFFIIFIITTIQVRFLQRGVNYEYV